VGLSLSQFRDDVRIEQIHSFSLFFIVKYEWAQLEDRAPGRERNIVGAIRIEQDVFDRWSSVAFQALPFIDGNEDGGFHSAARDHLRAVFERGVEKLAKASLCVVDLPCHERKSLLI
jgi:hypothetical protein